FLLESGILDDRIRKSARRLIGKHVEMSLLINAARPALGHVFGQLRSEMGSLRIGDLQRIRPTDGLNGALLSETPYVARKTRDFAHHRPAIVVDHHAQILLFIRTHVAPQRRGAAGAPEKPSHVGILLEKLLDAFADIFSVEFLRDLLQSIGNLGLRRIERVVNIRPSLFEPLLWRFWVGKALIDPSPSLHVALLRRKLP